MEKSRDPSLSELNGRDRTRRDQRWPRLPPAPRAQETSFGSFSTPFPLYRL